MGSLPSPVFSPSPSFTTLSPSFNPYDEYLYGQGPGVVDDVPYRWMRFCVASVGLLWVYVVVSFVTKCDCLYGLCQAKLPRPSCERGNGATHSAIGASDRRRNFVTTESSSTVSSAQGNPTTQVSIQNTATSAPDPPSEAVQRNVASIPDAAPSIEAPTAAEGSPTDLEQQHVTTTEATTSSDEISSSLGTNYTTTENSAVTIAAAPAPVEFLAADLPQPEISSVPSTNTLFEETDTFPQLWPRAQGQQDAVERSAGIFDTTNSTTTLNTSIDDAIDASISQILAERERRRYRYRNRMNKLHLKNFVYAMRVCMVKQCHVFV